MIVQRVDVLILNVDMKKNKDNVPYASVGIVTVDDQQKFDVMVRDASIYETIKPMTKTVCDLQLTNSQYGMRLSVLSIEAGQVI